jgi:hypothetical protein
MERRAGLHLLNPMKAVAESRRTALAAACLLWATSASWVEGKVFLTQEEALRLAFPAGTTVTRRTAFLTPAQQEAVKKLSGAGHLPSALATYYVGVRDGREVGTAYFDVHVVRTETETLMILVDSSGAIGRIEVLAFAEPEEYLPRTRWYAQFSGRKLDDELAVSRAIRPVSGATLTVRATTEAARGILALHQVIHAPATKPR